MSRNNVADDQKVVVDNFLSKYLIPPPGKTATDVRSRILHWITVANNPVQFNPEADVKTLADLRRKARQNVRRLALRHPQIARQIATVVQPEVSR